MAWSLSSLTPPPHPTPPTSSAGIHPSSNTQGLGLQSQGTFTGCPLCLEHAPPCLLLAGCLIPPGLCSGYLCSRFSCTWFKIASSLPPLPSSLLCVSRALITFSYLISFYLFTHLFFPPPTLSLTEHKLQASQGFFPLFLFPVCCPKSETKRKASTDLCPTNAWVKHDSFYFLSFTSSFLQFPSLFFFFFCSGLQGSLKFYSLPQISESICHSLLLVGFALIWPIWDFKKQFSKNTSYYPTALCFAYTCV